MKESYESNYLSSIYEGLKNTSYRIENNSVGQEEFYQRLVSFSKDTVKDNSGRLFFFGNGASAAFSNHMALDWSKNGGIPALSLSDSALLTALANDYSYEGAFLEYLKINLPTNKDLIITTSSSGNSKNVVNVLEYCKENNIKTFALSGLNAGNKSEQLSDFSLFVPMKTYGMVECIHQVFHHLYLDKYMNIEEWTKVESQNMDNDNFRL